MQLTPGPNQSMVQIDQDYTGKDFSASLKSINPSILDGGLTGIFVGSYLQSITPGLSLGMDVVWQRAAMNTGPETVVSYAARYKGSDWIAAATLQPQGTLTTTYWRRLMDKVEVGAELNLQFQPGIARAQLLGAESEREGTATVGAKYGFRGATFRAQADSSGRLSALVEKSVLPFVQVMVAAEMDQLKVRSFRFGAMF
jgi:mitochondrial import receptor subunit TOM40